MVVLSSKLLDSIEDDVFLQAVGAYKFVCVVRTIG